MELIYRRDPSGYVYIGDKDPFTTSSERLLMVGPSLSKKSLVIGVPKNFTPSALETGNVAVSELKLNDIKK